MSYGNAASGCFCEYNNYTNVFTTTTTTLSIQKDRLSDFYGYKHNIITPSVYDHDGNCYVPVRIGSPSRGSQIWLSQPFIGTHFASGTAIPIAANLTDLYQQSDVDHKYMIRTITKTAYGCIHDEKWKNWNINTNNSNDRWKDHFHYFYNSAAIDYATNVVPFVYGYHVPTLAEIELLNWNLGGGTLGEGTGKYLKGFGTYTDCCNYNFDCIYTVGDNQT